MKEHIITTLLFLCIGHYLWAQINLNADAVVIYQTIDNFAASDAWVTDGIGKHWSEQKKARAAELLFSTTTGIGLSGWRFNIGAGSAITDTDIIPESFKWRRAECFQQVENAPFDWTRQAGQQYFLRKAKEYNVSDIIAFLNSPPVWATKNGHAQCDTSVGSTNLKNGYEDEFAKFMVEIIKHFRNEEININYLSPINEPSWDWNRSYQEGCRYNNNDIVRVINAVYSELVNQNLADLVEIDAPEVTEYTAALDNDLYQQFSGAPVYSGGNNGRGWGVYRNYIKLLLDNTDLSNKIGNKISMHGYFSDNYEDRLTTLRDLIRQNVDRYKPNAHIWMSELSILGNSSSVRPFVGQGRDLGMMTALHLAKVIQRDLTRMNASAWHWWTAISKEDYKDGLLYTDWNSPRDPETLFTSKMLWAMGNYSRFIRPGYKRIKLNNPSDDWDGLLGSAYSSPENDKLVLVYVNSSNQATYVNTQFQNLSSGITTITPYVTSSSDDLAQKNQIGTITNYRMPAKSIVTFVVTLGGIVPIPTTPTNLVANSPSSCSNTTIELTWNDTSNNELRFRVQQSLSGTGGWSTIASLPSNATTHFVTNLNTSTTYHYRVRAENGSGNSSWSSVANATTQNTGGTIISGGIYSITNKATAKVIDVPGGSIANGERIHQWSCNNEDNQKWKVENVGGQLYKVTSLQSNKVLDVENASNSNGAAIIQWEYYGGQNQKWKIESTGNGYFRLIASHSNKVLDVPGGDTNNGITLIQYDANNGDNQKWSFQLLSSNKNGLIKDADPAPKLFPNPASGSLMLTYQTSKRSLQEISIVDMTGRILQVIQHLPSSMGLQNISLDSYITMLRPGHYFIRTDANKVLSFIKY